VLVAPSAEDAVTVYDAHASEVALVLTDLVMPGMGGSASCARSGSVPPAHPS
jgi:CheY-like chemotaxis protein